MGIVLGLACALQPVAAVDVITLIGVINNLGTLGGANSSAYAISNNDAIVGWSTTLLGAHHAFRWIDGAMLDLGVLGGSFSEARDVNDAGQITGQSSLLLSSDRHAVSWSALGVATDLGTLGGGNSSGLGINRFGVVVGQSETLNGQLHAFFWNGTMLDLGTLDGNESLAEDINDNNVIVGWAKNASGAMRAVQWTLGPLNLTDLQIGGDESRAFAINNASQIAGSDVNSGVEEGFRREANGSLKRFTLISGQRVLQVRDIDNRGFNVGQGLMNTGTTTSTVWWDEASEARDQGTLGDNVSIGLGMNNFGGMAGESTLANGDARATFWRVDTDGDGVYDEVDTLLGVVSDNFSDVRLGGITSGDIANRGDQRVIVIDEPSPLGVRVLNGPTEQTAPATLNGCLGLLKMSMNAGDNMVYTCTSINVSVDTGPVDFTLTGTDGTRITVAVGSGQGFLFIPANLTVMTPATNNATLSFFVGGCLEVKVAPGENKSLSPWRAFNASQDSFVRGGSDNTNEGANPVLRLQAAGPNRPLVRFNLTGLSTSCVTNATLLMNVEDASGLGSGRNVTVRRLLASWAEGNGWNTGGSIRGTGSGVTWNCATDSNITNQQPDCAAQWAGGNASAATAPGVLHANGMTGIVAFNVTQDVVAGAQFGWLVVKQSETQNGKIGYGSREGNVSPKLVLRFG